MLHFIYGGSGSGKSEYAEAYTKKLQDAVTAKFQLPSPIPLYYIACMLPEGKEAEERIQRHRAMREGKGFSTIERYYDVGKAVEKMEQGSVALVECIGNLTANEMFSREKTSNERILNEKISNERISREKISREKISREKISREKISREIILNEKISNELILENTVSKDTISNKKLSQDISDSGRVRKTVGSTLVTAHITEGLELLMAHTSELVVVSNEIGMAGAMYDATMRDYMVCLSGINRWLAEKSVYSAEIVYGIPVPL